MMKKSSKIVLSIILSVVVVFVIMFTILLQSSCVGVKGTLPSVEYTRFFRQANENNDTFGDTPLDKVAMLASHDALSYNICRTSIPNCNEDNLVNTKAYYDLARGMIVRLARAQYHDIYTQMKYGVRFVDARITYIDGEYYNSHGLVSHKLCDSLTGILKFLYENPGEFVIFMIQYYYDGSSNDQMLDEYIASVKYEGKSMYDYVNYDVEGTHNVSDLTYNKLTSNGTKAGVLMMARQYGTTYYDYFKLYDAFGPWHNKTQSSVLINEIAEWESRYVDDGNLHINQAQLSPNFEDWWHSITGWSLLKMAERHNAIMIENENFDHWLTYMPIYWCDYTTSVYGDFNNKVNTKLLNYNIGLNK